MSFTYLASPYSHPDEAVRAARFDRVVREAAKLMQRGECVFCPIAHSHPIDLVLPKIEGHSFWMGQDIPILRHAQKMKVLMLEGWEKSVGIAQELEFCRDAHIPIEYIGDTEARGPVAEPEPAERNYGGTCSE